QHPAADARPQQQQRRPAAEAEPQQHAAAFFLLLRLRAGLVVEIQIVALRPPLARPIVVGIVPVPGGAAGARLVRHALVVAVGAALALSRHREDRLALRAADALAGEAVVDVQFFVALVAGEADWHGFAPG